MPDERRRAGRSVASADRSSSSSRCCSRFLSRSEAWSSGSATGTRTRSTSRRRPTPRAFAGGDAWAFPCGASGGRSTGDRGAGTHVRRAAHADATASRTQDDVQPAGRRRRREPRCMSVLNGPTWYDNDSNPAPRTRTSPAGLSICQSSVLDVKVDRGRLVPARQPDPASSPTSSGRRASRSRRSRASGLLPIAVRVPKPLSAAASSTTRRPGSILSVKYFCQDEACSGYPAASSALPSGSRATGRADPRRATSTTRGRPSTSAPRRASSRHELPSALQHAGRRRSPCFDDGFTKPSTRSATRGRARKSSSATTRDRDRHQQNVESGLQFIHGYASGAGSRTARRTSTTCGSTDASLAAAGTSTQPTLRLRRTTECRDRPRLRDARHPAARRTTARRAAERGGSLQDRVRPTVQAAPSAANCSLQTASAVATITSELVQRRAQLRCPLRPERDRDSRAAQGHEL